MSALKVHGTDLSHHNPDPDLRAAKAAGLLWGYHKATEGSTLIDRRYADRRRTFEQVGIPFGAYHFARPDGADAKLEANHFFKVSRPSVGDLVPVLDYEVDFKGGEAWCKTFMKEIERLTKAKGLLGKPMHYGPDDFGKDYPYLRWVPRYNRDNRRPSVPWDIHQFSGGTATPGTPVTFPGLGAVDLNNMRDGLSLSDFRLRAIKAKPKSKLIQVVHVSMQFNDTPDQKKRDAKVIFRRAKRRNVAWVTGTEAGAGDEGVLRRALSAEAKANGYRFWMNPSQDSWFAVREDLIHGKWDTYTGPVIIDGKKGQYTNKNVVSVSFYNRELGDITIIASHYLTKGRPSAKDPLYRKHVEENRKLAHAIGAHARARGKGAGLVFYGGDQNIVDRTDDTFFGQPLTSLWDELGRWDNTGHGNIDVIASFDGDGRVEGNYCRALDDSEFRLATDHFMVEGGFDIRLLKAA